MIYSLISSKVCIGRTIERFNIDYAGLIPRVPNYIYSALREISRFPSAYRTVFDIDMIAYKGELPTDMSELLAVLYEGYRLPRVNYINENVAADIEANCHPTAYYQLDGNGNISTSFETGTISVIYKKLPIEYDTNSRLWFPQIPDVEDLLIALDWYILKRLLERGHDVVGYSLNNNNEYTNPALAWDKYKKVAYSSLNPIDFDTRKQLSDTIRNFIVNKNYYYEEEVNLPNL